MAFKFERLMVWERALQLSVKVHELARTFPTSERFVLTEQMQRAADSIALNVAEGSTGQTNGEFKQFLGYAIRSAIELVACFYLARGRAVLAESRFQELYAETESLVRMLQALRKSLK